MGIVINMKGARRQPSASGVLQPVRSIAGGIYCCLRCGSQLFRIYENRIVRCNRCAAEFRLEDK